MMGPFELLTTSKSGARAGAAAAPWLACSVGASREHPARSAPAVAATAARPKSLRVTTAAALPGGAGAHVSHPVELQVPHALFELPITFNGFSILASPSSRPFEDRNTPNLTGDPFLPRDNEPTASNTSSCPIQST